MHKESRDKSNQVGNKLDEMKEGVKQQKEIALIMDITEKAVEGILTRSKAILKEEISKFYPEMREKGKKRD